MIQWDAFLVSLYRPSRGNYFSLHACDHQLVSQRILGTFFLVEEALGLCQVEEVVISHIIVIEFLTTFISLVYT